MLTRRTFPSIPSIASPGRQSPRSEKRFRRPELLGIGSETFDNKPTIEIDPTITYEASNIQCWYDGGACNDGGSHPSTQ
jgi:hypothetical protein